jgi:hypothetical protein
LLVLSGQFTRHCVLNDEEKRIKQTDIGHYIGHVRYNVHLRIERNMAADKTPSYVKMDEKNHVEEPFLQQLENMHLCPRLHYEERQRVRVKAPLAVNEIEISV